jgi:hypothetical protein
MPGSAQRRRYHRRGQYPGLKKSPQGPTAFWVEAYSAGKIFRPMLALQLPFMEISESMSNHDSEIVGADGVD